MTRAILFWLWLFENLFNIWRCLYLLLLGSEHTTEAPYHRWLRCWHSYFDALNINLNCCQLSCFIPQPFPSSAHFPSVCKVYDLFIDMEELLVQSARKGPRTPLTARESEITLPAYQGEEIRCLFSLTMMSVSCCCNNNWISLCYLSPGRDWRAWSVCHHQICPQGGESSCFEVQLVGHMISK